MSKNSSSSLFSFSKLQSYFCYCKQFKPKMGETASRLIFCSSAITVYFLTAFISLHCNFFFCMFLCVCLPFFLLFGLWTSFCLSLAQSVYAFFPLLTMCQFLSVFKWILFVAILSSIVHCL